MKLQIDYFRTTFIILTYLLTYTLCTFTIGGRDDSPGLPEDKKNFGLLLQEMRPVFDQHGLLLTAAVSAGKSTIDKAYDVPVMRHTLDFINVMTYDYHGW